MSISSIRDSCRRSFHSLGARFHLSNSIANCQQIPFVSISNRLTMSTNNSRPAFAGDPTLDNPKLIIDSCRNVDLPLAAFNLNNMASCFSLESLKKRRLVVFTRSRCIARWLFNSPFFSFLFLPHPTTCIAYGFIFIFFFNFFSLLIISVPFFSWQLSLFFFFFFNSHLAYIPPSPFTLQSVKRRWQTVAHDSPAADRVSY